MSVEATVLVVGSVEVIVSCSVTVVVFWGRVTVNVVFVAGKVSVDDVVTVSDTGTAMVAVKVWVSVWVCV